MPVDVERKLQNRVIHWLRDELGYMFIGDLTDQNNEPINEKLLRKNLVKRGYSRDVIKRAIRDIQRKANNQTDSLYHVNKEIYSLLRYGDQGIRDERGNRITVHYIDWNDVEKNDFYVAEEVSVLRYNRISKKRPDLVLYLNGIAVVMFELKRSCVSSGEGIRQMLTNQKKENIQGFFSTMQLLMAGNEAEGLRYGVIETPEKYYLSWIEDTNATDDLSVRIRDMHDNNRLRNGVISLCHPERLLQLIHDFIIFDAGVKKTARHNQYFAVLAAQKIIRQSKGGIIWNTQGSGKSLIMVWLAKWIIENINDSRVVIITDRDELDDQIEGLFHNVGEKYVRRAQSCADLRSILNNNEDSIICSLIHKYGHNAGRQADIDQYTKELIADLPKDYEAKGNIIGFIDECHRTNSGKLHKAVEILMPNAVLIGFTGTPLLKTDKLTSKEVFGSYIHTYKFDEGVRDGVILDLRYEARDVNQTLSSQDKVDMWFDSKTKGLTERAKQQLKQGWATLNKLYSSRERLERIAADIIYDMSIKPRLVNDRGTAMLVAGSIYEACKYWEIFQANGFTKCAVITSYEPTIESVRTATYDLSKESEEEYKKNIYDRMLGGKTQKDFENEAKQKFIKTPAEMKLLIVVDKLLTGFDAPSATYLYIDKKMRDHDLFQTVCRTNRPDGDDKDYGYIIDYMDLFRNLQLAVKDYTSDAFDGFDKKDVEGLLKSRYDEAKAAMVNYLAAIKELFSELKSDIDYIDYFCGDDKVNKRETLYTLVSSLTRAFANCCDRLVSHYSYDEKQVEELRRDIDKYNKIKDMIRLASCDYIDLKPYEADMRYMLDTYIRAEDSTIINKMEDMSLIELLIDGNTTTPVELVKEFPGDDSAKAETITNNIKFEIVKKRSSNEGYYGKMSDMLQSLIERRKIEAMSYEEYLKHVVALAKLVFHPEDDSRYPPSIKDSAACRAIYDYLDDEDLTLKVDRAIRSSARPDWKNNRPRQQDIKNAIYVKLCEASMEKTEAEKRTEELFEIANRQEEYER